MPRLIHPRWSWVPMLAAGMIASMPVSAQDAKAPPDAPAATTPAHEPGTGDAWLDSRVRDIDAYARRYPATFADELARYFALPRAQLRAALAVGDLHAGDVYIGCALARAATQSCASVLQAWRADHADGWAGIARALGLGPGSRDWHQLKVGVVASYDRWGRPVAVDRELHADFPQRPAWTAPPAASTRSTRNASRPGRTTR